MFLALGVGAFSTGIFHVTTHAFFKALMFLGAGSVIHSMHDEQDITNMGGLKNKMKVTFLTFLMGAIAISGIPPFSGFFSKDEIFANVFFSGKYFYFAIGLLVAFFTAFYIFRLMYLTFFGEPRYDEKKVHPHESPKSMTVPLTVLAVLSVIGGFIGLPHIISTNLIEHWLEPVFSGAKDVLPERHPTVSAEIILIIVSVAVAVIAIYLAKSIFLDKKKLEIGKGGLYDVVKNKYYVDEFYDSIIVKPLRNLSSFFFNIFDFKLIDGVVNGTGNFFRSLSEDWRKLQTGLIQDYAVVSIGGIIVIILYILLT
jgi:NADH-quinone oxidoreductase subunit L